MSLRLLLLIAIVVALCVAALFRPRIGVYGYIWYAVMRPDVLVWAADQYPFSIALAAATLFGALRYIPRIGQIVSNPISGTLLALQVPLLASVIAAVDPSLSRIPYYDYVTMLAVPLLIPLLIETEQQLIRLLLVIAGSLGFLGAKFGIFGLLAGGTELLNGYGGMMSDNNLVALALAMGVPLCWYLGSFIQWRLSSLVCVGLVLSSTAAIVMTGSRGGSLSLATAFVPMILRSKHRAMTFVVLVLLSSYPIYLVQERYFARMGTLSDIDQERSANSRKVFAKAALEMWKDYPILGVGFGAKNFVKLSERYLGFSDVHVVHNSYVQMLVDSGFVALGLYCGLLFGTVVWLGFSVKDTRNVRPDLVPIPAALQASLLAFCVGGAFYSSQRYDLPYIIILTAAAWWKIQRDLPRESTEEVEADLAGALRREEYAL